MKCPQCSFISSNKRDLCPKCGLDLTPRKRELGLPVGSGAAKKSKAQASAKNLPETKGGWLGKFFKPSEKPQAAETNPQQAAIDQKPVEQKAPPKDQQVKKAGAASPQLQQEDRTKEKDEKATATVPTEPAILKAKEVEVKPSSSTVMEFNDDDEHFHETLDQLIGDMQFDVEAVAQKEKPKTEADATTIQVEDDLELVFEFGGEEEPLGAEEEEAQAVRFEKTSDLDETLPPELEEFVQKAGTEKTPAQEVLSTDIEPKQTDEPQQDPTTVPLADDEDLFTDDLIQAKPLLDTIEPEADEDLEPILFDLDQASKTKKEKVQTQQMVAPTQSPAISPEELARIAQEVAKNIAPLQEAEQVTVGTEATTVVTMTPTQQQDLGYEEKVARVLVLVSEAYGLEPLALKQMENLAVEEDNTRELEEAHDDESDNDSGPSEVRMEQAELKPVSMEELFNLASEEDIEISTGGEKKNPEEAPLEQLAPEAEVSLWAEAEAQVGQYQQATAVDLSFSSFEVIKPTNQLTVLFDVVEREIEGDILVAPEEKVEFIRPGINTEELAAKSKSLFEQVEAHPELSEEELLENLLPKKPPKKEEWDMLIPASITRRLTARTIDLLAISASAFFFSLCFVTPLEEWIALLSFEPSPTSLAAALKLGSSFGLTWLSLWVVSEVAFTVEGQTFGKRLMKICVRDVAGNACNWEHALARVQAEALSVATGGVGFLLGLTGSKRALHDRLAKTQVVYQL